MNPVDQEILPGLPDPLAFVLEALEREGALAERQGERATLLLPPPLSRRL